MKIAFLNRGHASWTAGSNYTRSMVHALASARTSEIELSVIGGCDAALPDVPDVRLVRAASPQPQPAEIAGLVASHGFDVLLPLTETVPPDIACAVVGWIPDFQHRRLPQYFSAEQRGHRDAQFEYLTSCCDAMLCSSHAVQADLREFYPEAAARSAVAPFPSAFAYAPEEQLADPTPVVARYGLPAAYAVVINQFWRHKNHRVVVEAIARARRDHPRVFVVMTGMLSDSRDATNAHVSEIVQRTFREKLYGNLAILGEVPGEDLAALLRAASAVIQPSEFEGWNTTVQDAIAFGKPIACSDLPVHREQAPAAAFFPVHEAEPLAEFLRTADWSSPGWSGPDHERAALAAERDRGREWGARLIELCRQAMRWRVENPDRRSRYVPSAEAQRAHAPTRARQLEARVKELEGELREAKRSARDQLAKAQNEARAATERYWAERRKRLRDHVRDALFGRRD